MTAVTGMTGDFATVVDLFDAIVVSNGDREAFVHEGNRITFAEWAARADALAGWLIEEHGIATGDVVGIRLPSGIDYAIAYQAIIRAGGVATGIDPRLGPAEVAHITATCTPRFVFDGPLPAVTGGDPLRRRGGLSATDPVAIVWTGGTTGLPRGAWFDHSCLRAMARGAKPLSEPGDRRLSPFPFSHVGAMTRAWDELQNLITTVVVPTPWTPAAALALIAGERVTVCQGVPAQYRLMLNHPDFATTDVSSLRVAAVGEARVPPELVAEMRYKLGCPVVVRYASTESSLATGTRLDDSADVICNTVGRPSAGVELMIVDELGTPMTGRGPDFIGTVCVRSRAMMRGYWNDPVHTREAIDTDGWLHTGDLGWMGRDGNLRLVGRSTEVYIRGGNDVYPVEVENCLGSYRKISAAAVVGAPVKGRLGEIGVLFAVPAQGAALDIADIQSFVKRRLAGYKAPDCLVVMDELPLTSTGKVDKVALQPRAHQEAAAWTH